MSDIDTLRILLDTYLILSYTSTLLFLNFLKEIQTLPNTIIRLFRDTQGDLDLSSNLSSDSNNLLILLLVYRPQSIL